MAEPNDHLTTLPDVVTIEATPRLTPNEIRALKVATGGRAYGEVMQDEADAMQAMVWVTLRRLGYEPSWDAAGGVLFEMDVKPADPTNGEP